MKQARTRLRVLLLSPHYPPDVAATGQLVAELAEDIVSAGHEAIVIASRQIRTGSKFKLVETERRDGVTIHWLGVPHIGRRGVWSRLLPFAGYFFAAALRSMSIRRVDVVFAQSTPPLLAGLLAAMHTFIPGRRFVYSLQDVYPELGQALGVLNDGFITRLSKKLESRLRHRADVLTVLADDMRGRVLNSDPGLDNIVIVPNWADSERVVPVPSTDNRFRREHALDGKFVVMYSGNLGRAHGVELLPAVAQQLSDIDDLVLLIIGDGAASAQIRSAVAACNLKNVVCLPYQPKDRLKESLSAADVALILQRQSVSGLVVPSKMYGILASGRPAVAAVPADSEVARVLQEQQAGIVVQPGSAREISDAVRALWASREVAEQMGRQARLAAVNRHDRRQATGRYIRMFEQLVLS